MHSASLLRHLPRARALVALAVSLAGLSGCSAFRNDTPAEINEMYADILRQRSGEYRIKPGDTLRYTALKNEDQALNQESIQVLPDGRTDLLLLGTHQVAGKTVDQVEKELATVFRQKVQDTEDLDISIQVLPAPEYVYIGGEFERLAGAQIVLQPRMTVQQLVAMYNTTKITGDTDWALLRRPYSEDPIHPKMEVFRIDLHDLDEDIYLLPGDQVILERNFVAGVINYLREYLFGAFPFSGLVSSLATGV